MPPDQMHDSWVVGYGVSAAMLLLTETIHQHPGNTRMKSDGLNTVYLLGGAKLGGAKKSCC
ncbi:hypothetical protein DESC_770045 [Desulfosarcina cetonica]|nr:hypothetical protein DESC_770045 [Desulfosarcina cetonica]